MNARTHDEGIESRIGILGMEEGYTQILRPQYKLDIMTSHDGEPVEVHLSWSLLARLT